MSGEGSQPEFSVIIPAFNRAEPLLKAVKSVLGQTYRRFELIVVDDGSTADLSESHRLVIENDHRWLVLPENYGAGNARNFGVKQAGGQLIAFLDSDDHWLPDKLKLQAAYHGNNPACLISHTQEIWYRRQKRTNVPQKYLAQQGDLFEQALDHCVISSSSVVIDKKFFNRSQCYASELRVCEDYALWLFVTAAADVGLVDKQLTAKFGGAPDQLSASYAALDRYRLAALARLFRANHKSPILSTSQLASAQKVFRSKANILAVGALKHQPQLVSVYKKLAKLAASPEDNYDLLDLLISSTLGH